MKPFLSFLLFLPLVLQAQAEFSFELYFEDAVGNRDTLVLGYDALASDTIDASFGEENIISQPWDSLFEVRVTNKMQSVLYGLPELETFQTKKQFIKKHCGENWANWSLIYFDIKNSHFPITISWNSTIFNNQCVLGSVIQDDEINSWFDVGNFDGHLYNNQNSISSMGSNLSYQDTNSYTYYSYWLMFGDSTFLTLENNELGNNEFYIFPNPTNGKFKYYSEKPVSKIMVYDMQGKLISIIQDKEEIDITNTDSGIYLVEYKVNGTKFYKKVIKN